MCSTVKLQIVLYICDIWSDFKNKASWPTVHILRHIMTSELLSTVWNGHDLVWFRPQNWQQEEIVLVKLIFESHSQHFKYLHADHTSVSIWPIGDETQFSYKYDLQAWNPCYMTELGLRTKGPVYDPANHLEEVMLQA